MSLKGHPINVVEFSRDEPDGSRDHLSAMLDGDISVLLVRNVFQTELMAAVSKRLQSSEMEQEWMSPNRGMAGGEIRTIGEAATPTFTRFGGPTLSEYQQSVHEFERYTQSLFCDDQPTSTMSRLFSDLFGGRHADSARFTVGGSWLPYNFRSLDAGHQIYAHHDNHYRLPIYNHLPARFDRTIILSWFALLQAPEVGGELIVYGLFGSDPNPPMLPTRFLDTEVLENEYKRCAVPMQAGDVVIFNSGDHVHRVSAVDAGRSRLTMGGFATVDDDRTQLIYWS